MELIYTYMTRIEIKRCLFIIFIMTIIIFSVGCDAEKINSLIKHKRTDEFIVNNWNEIDEINLSAINTNSITIKKIFSRNEYEVLIYTYSRDNYHSEDFYAGIQINNVLYQIEKFTTEVYQDDISITEFEEGLCIKGIQGANCPISCYVSLKRKIPTLLISINKVMEQSDIDNDEEMEIIASFDGEIILYKFFSNKLYSASINELLEKDRLYFESEEKFFTDGNSQDKYMYFLNTKKSPEN